MYMVAAAHKKGEGGARARARTPPPPSRKGALCACGILSIYLSNMRQIPAAACVARFWAQPPKYKLSDMEYIDYSGLRVLKMREGISKERKRHEQLGHSQVPLNRGWRTACGLGSAGFPRLPKNPQQSGAPSPVRYMDHTLSRAI